MQDTTFVTLVSWVIAHGYALFFIAAVLEGPLVTAAAGVAASLGVFSLPIVILISIAGDLIADIVYYSIGYWGGRPFVARYGGIFKLTPERITKFESLIHRHLGKTLVFFKLSPVIPVPGILMVGTSRAPLKRFIKISLAITLPKSLLFAFLGFYSGKAYKYLSGSIVKAQYAVFIVTLLIFAVYFLYKWVTSYLANQIDDKNEEEENMNR